MDFTCEDTILSVHNPLHTLEMATPNSKPANLWEPPHIFKPKIGEAMAPFV